MQASASDSKDPTARRRGRLVAFLPAAELEYRRTAELGGRYRQELVASSAEARLPEVAPR